MDRDAAGVSRNRFPYTRGNIKTAGQPARPGRHLTPGSLRSRAAATGRALTAFAMVAALVLATLAAIGVAVSIGIWTYNVKNLYDQVNQLEAELAMISGNGTTFFDDTWVMANGPQPGRKFMFNASLVAMGIKRNFALPDADGIILLEETFDPVFAENEFAIVGEFDTTTRIEFDLSLIPGSTTYVYSWPNKAGTVALLSDIIGILINGSSFFDSSFQILNDPDATKIAMFYAGDIPTGTTQQFAFPPLNGTLALTAGAQTISDKTLDNTNSLTIVDSSFVMEEVAGGNAVFFNADALTGNQTASFPDLTGTFAYTDGAQTISDKTLDNTNSLTIVDSNLAIQDTAGGNSLRFDADALTADRAVAAPDLDGDMLVVTAAGFVNFGTTLRFGDSTTNLYQVGDSTARVDFDLSAVSTATTRTASFQDKDCTLACLDDVTNGTFVDAGTWSPNISDVSGSLGGSPSVAYAVYTQTKSVVTASVWIEGLDSAASAVDVGFRLTLPVPRSGAFADRMEANGIGAATGDTSLDGDPLSVKAVVGAQKVLVEWRTANNGAVAINVQFSFTYTI